VSTPRRPPRSASRDAAIQRRRRGLLVVVLGLLIVGVLAYAMRPSDAGSEAVPVSTESAIDLAAKTAAANAAEGAKAADAVEQRAWGIGQYANAVPPSDGVNAGVATGNLVALTFDDGPGKDTWDVLALLKRYKMQGTFFVVGQNLDDHPGALRAMVEQGHVVADHSWTHASLPSLDTAGLRRELVDTRAAILQETGRVPTLMRPPFGDFTAKTNEFSRRQGMLPVLWTVDSNDWALSDPGTIAANVLNSPALKPGAIILLHDGSMNRQMTVDALPLILDGLVARGLRSVTVPELLRAGQPSIASPGDYKLSDYADASN
jgi:peptidoglycan/xylan/chitin deacetylase (PgdA/CDA1 family)